MKEIEQYIEFAIENDYKLSGYEYSHKDSINFQIIEGIDFNGLNDKHEILDKGVNFTNKVEGLFIYDKNYNIYRSLEKTLQEKEFIEAIARGIEKKSDNKGFLCIKWLDNSSTYGLYSEDYGPKDRIEIELISDVTHYQAIAIRDNKFPEFIINLGVIGNQ